MQFATYANAAEPIGIVTKQRDNQGISAVNSKLGPQLLDFTVADSVMASAPEVATRGTRVALAAYTNKHAMNEMGGIPNCAHVPRVKRRRVAEAARF